MDPHLDRDPPFDHFKYLHQNGPNWAQTLYMCSSRHSRYNSGLFCVSSCKENEIEKTASVTLADGCRVGTSTSKRDRICIASCLGVLSLKLSLFWTVTGCDRSKGGSRIEVWVHDSI